MTTTVKKKTKEKEITVEERLKNVFKLQLIHSEIDKIKILRGELPLVVQDLEDVIAGLQTRIEKYEAEVKDLQDAISKKKIKIQEAEGLIQKYIKQQENVRNNREFDSLSKEIEYQKLDIELSQKRIGEYTDQIKNKKGLIDNAQELLKERKDDLAHKKDELENIVQETKNKEQGLGKQVKEQEDKISPRILQAYKRIRKNARNGLAVVTFERDACGGCHNKIPPQRQMDIRARKRIIVCEYCGRLLVDPEMEEEIQEEIK